jgi:hypothetical protein
MKSATIVLSLVLLLIAQLQAQVTPALLTREAKERPGEKIYVQFDKPVYHAGETIWFKGHVFSGYQSSEISSVFYVELLNDSGRLLQHKVYPLILGSAAGHFDLPPQLSSQQVQVRAYTRWMLNFEADFLFRQSLPVIGTNIINPVKQTPDPYRVTVRFFPEGGDLVNETECRVAFEAYGNDGNPAKLSGTVYDEQDQVITTLKDVHDGMGHFVFTPEFSHQYKAVLKDSTGATTTHPLPPARFSGVSMQVTPHPSGRLITLSRSFTNSELYDTLYLLVMFQQQQVLLKQFIFEADVYRLGLPVMLRSLPSSVVSATVFSKNWQPLAERVFFLQNNNYTFPVTISPLEVQTNIRARNRFEISVTDTAISNLSVAVTDGRYSDFSHVNTIYSGLLLSSELRGAIRNPAQYFNNPQQMEAPLDLVMLTHGWRRYHWANLLQNQRPSLLFEPDSMMSITARLKQTDKKTNTEIMGIDLQYPKPDGTLGHILLPPAGEALYRRRGLNFLDSVKFTPSLLLKNKLEAKPELEIVQDFLPPLSINDTLFRGRKLNIKNYLSPDLQSLHARIDGQTAAALYNQMQMVTVKARQRSRARQIDELYTGGLFRGEATKVVDLTNGNSNPGLDFFGFLRLQAPPGLQIIPEGISNTVRWRQEQTAIFLDEMQVRPEDLQFLPVSDIAYIKFFQPPFYGAVRGGLGGAVSIYTKKGNEPTDDANARKQVWLKGFDHLKEFYAPDYSTGSLPKGVEDLRTTLLWKPFIFLSKEEPKTTIEFYNNDISRSFIIIVEGVLENGQLVRIEKRIQ